MADYGICKNQQCELFYGNAPLNRLDNKSQPSGEDLKVFQKNRTHCDKCHGVLLRTTDPIEPNADECILMIDRLRDRRILEWPGEPEPETGPAKP